MNRTLSFKIGALITVFVMSYVITVGQVRAHGDEVHEEGHHAETEKVEMSTTETKKVEMSSLQMERMIQILQQLVAVLTLYRAQYETSVSVSVSPDEVHDADHHNEEMKHEDEHHDDTLEDHAEAAVPASSLVIEVEPHNGKTHVHVRYTDKPEEMFFVDAPLNNEDEIVTAIVAKTSLGADVIKAALKYME